MYIYTRIHEIHVIGNIPIFLERFLSIDALRITHYFQLPISLPLSISPAYIFHPDTGRKPKPRAYARSRMQYARGRTRCESRNNTQINTRTT